MGRTPKDKDELNNRKNVFLYEISKEKDGE